MQRFWAGMLAVASLAMLKALQDQRKPVRFVQLPREDHWLSLSESRKRVLAEMETFLAEHLAVKTGS
jgi:dipeptidyl aminopeptidase/acylaminoacyl peptidase